MLSCKVTYASSLTYLLLVIGYYSLIMLDMPVFISLLMPLPSLGLAASISLRNLNIGIISSSTLLTSLNIRYLVSYLGLYLLARVSS